MGILLYMLRHLFLIFFIHAVDRNIGDDLRDMFSISSPPRKPANTAILLVMELFRAHGHGDVVKSAGHPEPGVMKGR